MLFGWNSRCILFTSKSANIVKKELAFFQKDAGEFVELCKHHREEHMAMRKRSQFVLVPTQQLLWAAKEERCLKVTPHFKAFLDKKHCRLLSSQCTEDCFNLQKG